MPAGDLPACLQILFALCATFIAFGTLASTNASRSIHAFFLLPPCSTADNSTRCCPTCLGISNFEYGLFVAFPYVVGIAIVSASGLLIDTFGLPMAAIFFALLSVFGSSLRALSPLLASNHAALITCLVFGQTAVGSANGASLACREYIAIRYFKRRKQPLTVGFAIGVSNLASMISCFVTPPIAAKFGVPAALWTCAGFSCIGLIVGVILGLLFCFSSAVQALEQELRDEQFAGGLGLQRRSCLDVIRSVKSFRPQFWFLLFAFVLKYCGQAVFQPIAPGIQMRLADITAVQAGINMAWGFLGFAAFAPSVGALLSLTGPVMCAAVFGTLLLLDTAGFALMFVRPEFGIGSIALCGAFITSVKSIVSHFVPGEYLGLASSLSWGIGQLSAGLISFTLGSVLEAHKGRFGAVIVVYYEIASNVVIVCLLLVMWRRYGLPKAGDYFSSSSTCSKGDNEEKRHILTESDSCGGKRETYN